MGQAWSARHGSVVTDDTVIFRLPDPDHRLTGATLWSPVPLPDSGVPFNRVEGGWELRIPLPRLTRIEYLFEVRGTGGGVMRTLDPGNPLRVGGAFGEHSWLPMPGYHAPSWLIGPAYAAHRMPHPVDTPDGIVDAEIWSPADAIPGEALPLLLSHDGPEMDRYGQLTHCVGALIALGRLPRMRVALLSPGARNVRYSASPAYAEALAAHVVPALLAAHPSDHPVVGMGQSLGALAMLHAEWSHPGTFGGLFLQSGSFFTPRLDPQESAFEWFGQITAFTDRVHTEPPPARPLIGVVCGTAEENLANNRALAHRLTEQGLDVAWGEVADGHLWTTWRDLLDPHLVALLERLWT